MTRRQMVRAFGLVVLVVLSGILVHRIRTRHREELQTQPIHEASLANSDDEFRPEVVIPRPFPPITKFPIGNAKTAQGQIGDRDLVLGVVVNGQARAYPINVLTGPTREILNDKLGDRPIAATW